MTLSFRADLHCHSSSSDGTLSPTELIDLAIERGLSAISITDHDTIAAYDIALPYAKEKGLLLGSGAEFSCSYKRKSVHVLAYDFSFSSDVISSYCQKLQHRRTIRNKEILDRLRGLRLPITEEELFITGTEETIGRPHIAKAMMQKGYVCSVQEAFHLYLGDTKCCYVPGVPFPVEEAIEVIHRAGGKAVLAHPHLYKDFGFGKEVLSIGFDGVECYYARAPLKEEKRWIHLAEEQGLLISGGSDFHGSIKPYIPLGCSFVDRERFFQIFTTLSL